VSQKPKLVGTIFLWIVPMTFTPLSMIGASPSGLAKSFWSLLDLFQDIKSGCKNLEGQNVKFIFSGASVTEKKSFIQLTTDCLHTRYFGKDLRGPNDVLHNATEHNGSITTHGTKCYTESWVTLCSSLRCAHVECSALTRAKNIGLLACLCPWKRNIVLLSGQYVFFKWENPHK